MAGVFPAYNGTMFSLQTQQSRVVDVPPGSSFRIWARTGCTNSTAGNINCQTGYCGSGKVNCSGYGFSAATNLAEFGLGYDDDLDSYDVSLVNGDNVAVAVVPQGGNGSKCAVTGCIYDIDGACPQELKLGGTCRRPCYPIENSSYCCTSNALNTVMCPPPVYSTLFKKACPRAYYRYALDGDTRTFRACAMMGGIFGSSVGTYHCHINSLSNFLSHKSHLLQWLTHYFVSSNKIILIYPPSNTQLLF